MKFIVDRFEEDFIVCEDENGNIVSIPKKDLGVVLKEGDVFKMDDDKIIKMLVDETLTRKQKVEKIVKNLWEN